MIRFALVTAVLSIVCCLGVNAAGLPGGYAPAETGSADVKQAAGFAVQAQAKAENAAITLNEIVSAEKQVVAGMNYRLELKVTSAGGKSGTASATVFRGLDGHYELKSWQWQNKS